MKQKRKISCIQYACRDAVTHSPHHPHGNYEGFKRNTVELLFCRINVKSTSQQYPYKPCATSIYGYIQISGTNAKVIKSPCPLILEEAGHFFYTFAEHCRLRIEVQRAVDPNFF